jgi:hypothetical protein
MSIKNLTLKITGGFLLIAVLASCSSPTAIPILTLAPTVNIQPTLDAVKTQSALTVIAYLTQNAPTITPTASPTSTPTYTSTPQFTPTKTNTLLPLWTKTPTQSVWGCEITSFSPALNASLNSSTDFDASWVVKNTGSTKWLQNDIDIRYSSGDKLQKSGDTIDLKKDVSTGESYTVAVNMRTPTDSGSHTTTWTVNRGTQAICTMTLTIVVK